VSKCVGSNATERVFDQLLLSLRVCQLRRRPCGQGRGGLSLCVLLGDKVRDDDAHGNGDEQDGHQGQPDANLRDRRGRRC
jgi:hypothetical protein